MAHIDLQLSQSALLNQVARILNVRTGLHFTASTFYDIESCQHIIALFVAGVPEAYSLALTEDKVTSEQVLEMIADCYPELFI